ncbi:MAG: signal recognition particle protein Srp54 [Candidatus Thermoplasmatota archaeon]|nr:signal recognition particle protein Srp54 [Candidatus Thermoplasmatota archaeon]MCK5301257.1 signal recognition particle protein [Thermoplasmatales archaeon]
MVLNDLSDSLKGTLKKIANAVYIDSKLIKEVVRDIQRALLQSDVNVKLVLTLSKEIEKRALQEKPPAGMSNREHVIHIVYDELVNILGKSRELPIKKQIIMMTGLYGQGKTTSCGKLASYFKKRGLRPVLIAGDVHRPAAFEQLKQIAEKVKVPFYGDKNEKNAVRVVNDGINKFKRNSDVIIVDTSGRHKLEDVLIQEMKDIFQNAKPDEKLLVIDAAMGQQAGTQAKAFNDAVDITGIILTKLDGTAKGGGALSAAAEVGAPILFIGTGEHSDDFETFDPASFISRILGMGDIKSLLEKAEYSVKGKDAEKTAKRMMSGKFTLNDMYDQMDMLSGMGPLNKIAEMLPGNFTGRIKNVDMDSTENKLQKFRVIMDSMTKEEMENPNLVRSARIKRIARGSGVENKDVKELLKYYNMTKRMMKGISGNRKMRKNLMKQLQFGN